MFGNLGTGEIILIILVVLLFFGAKKLPDLARGLGQGIREFKKAARDVKDEVEKEAEKLDENNSEKIGKSEDNKPIG
jgi:sec-independent protein translocase protein TatA